MAIRFSVEWNKCVFQADCYAKTTATQMKSYRKFFLPVLLLALILPISCKKDDNEPMQAPPELSEYDRAAIGKISVIAQVAESYFRGYDFSYTHPTYLIIQSPVSDDITGYLINPHVVPEKARKLTNQDSKGLNIYSYDEETDEVRAAINDGLFSLDFTWRDRSILVVNFQKFEGSFYLDYKDQNDNGIPGLFIHELFHVFQFATWDVSLHQDEYPVSLELLELSLLQFDLMTDAYFVDESEYTQYLRYYVAIWDKMISIDPSEDKLVLNMGTNQELVEGTARYIEHFSLKGTFFPTINNDPTHGFAEFLDNATTALEVERTLFFRAWYHQGAIATHMLKSLDVDVETKFFFGETPYQVAKTYLAMTEAELATELEAAKAQVTWADYQTRAQQLLEIINSPSTRQDSGLDIIEE